MGSKILAALMMLPAARPPPTPSPCWSGKNPTTRWCILLALPPPNAPIRVMLEQKDNEAV
jgi:hypothetical protein